MMKRLKRRAQRVVGLAGVGRDDSPPRYRAIAPGLIVTDASAWAWYEIPTTNSDLLSEQDRDAQQDQVEAILKVLQGREFHEKVLWGRISGAGYLHGLGVDPERSPAAAEWAAVRADNIDDLDLPSKKVLLGVKLVDRERRSGAGEYLGLRDDRVSAGELATLSSQAAQLGRALAATVWRVRLASTELLAWSIVRETHRDEVLPIEDVIEGSALARLASGRIEPYSDHLRAIGPDGTVSAYIAVLALSDWPEETTTPGQEYFGMLNRLETAPLETPGALGEPVPVLAEVSRRGRVPLPREARQTVDQVHDKAGEQIKSAAKSSAGEPDEEMLLAREETTALRLALRRGHTRLMEDHPRIVLSAESMDELQAKIMATTAAYDGMGITAHVAADEQRELWLEVLPCDKVRVPDLGHWRDSTAFAQSWSWGGSRVGTTDPRKPVIAYTTGSTQSLVRFLCTESTSNSDAPVTVLIGRTRRGKSVAMMMMVLDAALAVEHEDLAAWAVLVDTKGDCAGLVDAARHYGVDADLLVVGPEHAGAFDAFLTADPEHAVSNVVSQLSLLMPANMAVDAQGLLLRVASRVQHDGDRDPRSWKVIEELRRLGAASTAASLARDVSDTLTAMSRTGFGRLVAGRPSADDYVLPTRPGITVIQLPGLRLPDAGTSEASWSIDQRVRVAAMRGVLGWCATMAGAIELRRRAKVIAIPEVHVLTATSDGREFLTQTARMGAALGVSMILDTQDASGIASMSGLVEGIAAVFGFAQRSIEEQDALARMIGLEPSDYIRQVIGALDDPGANDLLRDDSHQHQVRRGHCLMQDRRGDVATVQWVIPSPELAAMLDTSAAATAGRAEMAEALARAARLADETTTEAGAA